VRLVSRATWNPALNRELGIRKGQRLLVLVIDQDSELAFADELKVIDKTQHDRYLAALERWDAVPPDQRSPKPTYEECLVELDVTVKVHYNGRSVEANGLWWSLLTLEANWINGTPMYRGGYWSKKIPDDKVTPQMIHNDELETYCEKRTMDVSEKDAWAYRRMDVPGIGRVHHIEPLQGGKVRLHIWKTTRFLDSREFSTWVKRKIEAIMSEGSLLKTDVPEFLMLKNQFLDLVKGKKKEKAP
jgi:hypothetical protein